MPDHQPYRDFTNITRNEAYDLYLAVNKQQTLKQFVMSGEATPTEVEAWAKHYMKATLDLEQLEIQMAQSLWIVPFTLHVAGAPGYDKDYDRGDDEDEWAGQVQKCSRCHDVLWYGFVAKEVTDGLTQAMTGKTGQEYMLESFGENPVDANGPSWFPIGEQIVKRPAGNATQVFPLKQTNPPVGFDIDLLKECLPLGVKAILLD